MLLALPRERLPEGMDALTQGAPQLRQALGAEEQSGDDQQQDQVGRALEAGEHASEG